MTRDFNKQYQNDNHSSRGRSSNRYNGEERSTPQPHARPNRASVDRGWENGASRSHPDYRSRSSNNTSEHSPRSNWQHRDQQAGNTSYNASRNRNERYQGDSRNQDQRHTQSSRFDNSSNTSGFRPRPSRSYNDDRQPGNNTRPPYNRYDRSQPSDHGSTRPSYNRPSTRSYRQDADEHGSTRSSYNRPSTRSYRQDADDRSPNERRYNGNSSYNANRRPASEHGRAFQSRVGDNTNNANNRPGTESYQRQNYNTHNQGPRRPSFQRQDQDEERPRNPRWLSRPEMRQAREQHTKQDEGQFEGDYEQFSETTASPPEEQTDFNRRNSTMREENKPRSRYKTRSQEIHVTRLPDGRVIKGSRPAQRKNAQFWTNINADTEGLLDQVQTPAQETERNPDHKNARGATNNAKKRKEGKKPRSNGPRPSQKGFEWPQATADETTTESE